MPTIYPLSQDQLLAFRREWVSRAKSKDPRTKLRASDFLLRCLLFDIPLRIQFQPVTSMVKRNNGQKPYQGLDRAIRLLRMQYQKAWEPIIPETAFVCLQNRLKYNYAELLHEKETA